MLVEIQISEPWDATRTLRCRVVDSVLVGRQKAGYLIKEEDADRWLVVVARYKGERLDVVLSGEEISVNLIHLEGLQSIVDNNLDPSQFDHWEIGSMCLLDSGSSSG